MIITAWLFSGFPSIWQNPKFPPEIKETRAASWYDANWVYRRIITLSTATATSSYQVKVTLTTAGMGNPYGNVNADGSDIRFTGADGTTLQDYWIESWDNTGTSTIWVEVAVSGTSAIYMYYGNAGAASASSGANTFLFFDDFPGSSIDPAKWAVHASGGTFYVTVSGGVLHQYATAGNHILRSIASPELTNNIIIEHKMKIGTYADATNNNRNRFYTTGAEITFSKGIFDNSANPTIQYNWNGYSGTPTTLDTWLRNVHKIYGSTVYWAVSNYSTGASEYSNSTTVTVTPPVKYYPWIGDYGATNMGGDIYSDWVFVRKYAASEPTAILGEVFSSVSFTKSGTYTGNGVGNRAITGIGFQPDVVIIKGDTAQYAVIKTSTMSGDTAKPMLGSTALTADMIQSLDPDGFTVGTNATVNSNTVTYYWIAFKAQANELKVSSYVGDGTAFRSITSVGFQPEFVFVMSAGAAYLVFDHASNPTVSYQWDDAGNTVSRINSLDSDGFSIGNSSTVNTNGTTYHYVAWNNVAGRINTGSYSGNATDNRDITGVGFQPEYVMIKPAATTKGVHKPDSTGAAVDVDIDFHNSAHNHNSIQALQSDGFQVGTNVEVNTSAATYYWIAFIKSVPQTFTQSGFRFFNNADSTDVGSALAALNTDAVLGSAGAAFRLRSLLHLGNDQLIQNGGAFKLQFVGKGTGTCASPSGGTPSDWTDVTAATAIAFKNNTPADGADLAANAYDPTHGADTIVNQTYEELNNFTDSVAAIPSGQDGKWDFALKDNSAPASTAYCFRMVKSDGSLIDTYSVFPQITTYSVGSGSQTDSYNDTSKIATTTDLNVDTGAGQVKLSAFSWTCGDTLTDSRDGKTYGTVLIGTQCWFKKNLDVGTRIAGAGDQTNNSVIEKYCYSNSDANCDTWGGLYQWDEAMGYVTTEGAQGICPAGWHIPGDTEWNTLNTYVGATPGTKLKALASNTPPWDGTDTVGFTALPAGQRYPSSFANLNDFAYFWSSLKAAPDPWNAYWWQLGTGVSTFTRVNYYRSYGLSVRCLIANSTATGTSTSTNLLSGVSNVTSIDSFYYNASVIPSGTSLKFRYSQDNTNWYDSAGALNGWDTAASTGGAVISLATLGWSGSNFYYQAQFNSDAGQIRTPVLDDIAVNYTAGSAPTPTPTPTPNSAPVVSNVQLNGQADINLTENTTTAISATATVTDADGCSTLATTTAKIYRSGVGGAEACSADANDCYSVASCTQDGGSCTSTAATYTCAINMQYHADPTDTATPWAAEYWRAWVQASDSVGATSSAYNTAGAPEVNSLLALGVTASIAYGNLNPGAANDPLDKTTTVTATGNVSLDITLYGTDMISGVNNIPAGKQRYALSAATSYASGTSLLLDPGATADLNCPKTTATGSPQTKNIWWGLQMPVPQPGGDYAGVNAFFGVKNGLPWP